MARTLPSLRDGFVKKKKTRSSGRNGTGVVAAVASRCFLIDSVTFVTTYVPSANKAIRDGCPDRLAVVSRLFGGEPAPPERCRVLELGCAEGAHLVPLAELAPESRFLGVDLDARAVERGNELVARLGLTNLTLETADFRAISERNERFDYVVAHGVYSWVAPDVRGALLALVAEVLDDEGVAYVSFNALPGTLTRASDSLVHHDYLAETNDGVTLPAFAEHLARHGLEYVTDASNLDRSAFTQNPLAAAFETPLESTTYVDRLEMQRFRQAVVRRRRAVPPALDLGRAERLWFASSAEPAARGDVKGSSPVRFKTVSGLELETNVPETKLALYELGRVWPEPLRLDDLSERVAGRLDATAASGALATTLLDSGASLAARAFFRRPRCVRSPSSMPCASATARLEASRGRDVTNVHHEPVKLDVAFHRELLSLLDGTRDRARLVREVSDAIEAGRVVVAGVDPKARPRWEGLMAREVDAGLERFSRFALLLG
jgi:SAM-dependent methyltransferase